MNSVNTQQDPFAALGLSRAPDSQKGKNDASQLGLDTFLKLMVTQLKNQDPFKPMDNSTFLGQVAQFGSVTGLDKLNKQIADLSTSLTSGQALQAGSLVGREVLVPLDTGVLQAGQPLRGQVSLPESSSAVTLRVYDMSGQMVRELPLGAADAGDLKFSWDGMSDRGSYLPPGRYRVEVEAQQGTQSVLMQPELFAGVESVSLSASNGLTLNLAGLGPVSFNSIKQIF
jgi:flagellar basal-body rod modification protein FlgD